LAGAFAASLGLGLDAVANEAFAGALRVVSAAGFLGTRLVGSAGFLFLSGPLPPFLISERREKSAFPDILVCGWRVYSGARAWVKTRLSARICEKKVAGCRLLWSRNKQEKCEPSMKRLSIRSATDM
jgi:hypothetical protein